MRDHVQYELKAWIEGIYVHRCRQTSDRCPYDQETTMAFAWLRGWGYQGCYGARRRCGSFRYLSE
jgi:hypothetical protein